MELKYERVQQADASGCSNRTFMELKCQSKVKATTKIKVLIVPLWN